MNKKRNNSKMSTNAISITHKVSVFVTAFVFVWVLGIGNSFAQVNKERKIDKQFNGIRELEVNHVHGDLEIRDSKDNSTKVNIVFSVDAKTNEDAQKILDHLNMEFQEAGDRLVINTKFDARSWNTNNGVTSIEFNDGTKVKNLKNIELFFTLYVPKLNQLSLANKYDDIRIEDDLTTNLFVKLNSGVLQAENIKGKVNLEGKYSKMKMKNVSGDLSVNLYDTDAEIGNANNVDVTSKYSGVTLGDVASLTYDSYDDNITVGTNPGELKLTSKYSEFNINGASKATIKSYDDVIELGNIKGTISIETKYSNVKAGTFSSATISSNDDEFIMVGNPGADMKVTSKYSEFKIEKLRDLVFVSSYDDQLDIDQLNSLNTNTKYGEYTISKLEKSVEFISNDDNLTIKEVGSGFTGATLSGKYSTFEIKLPSGFKYQLDAKMTYGKIVYPESNFEYGVHIEKGNTKEVKGKLKGASDNSPKIVINEAYDCQVYIK